MSIAVYVIIVYILGFRMQICVTYAWTSRFLPELHWPFLGKLSTFVRSTANAIVWGSVYHSFQDVWKKRSGLVEVFEAPLPAVTPPQPPPPRPFKGRPSAKDSFRTPSKSLPTPTKKSATIEGVEGVLHEDKWEKQDRGKEMKETKTTIRCWRWSARIKNWQTHEEFSTKERASCSLVLSLAMKIANLENEVLEAIMQSGKT